MVKTLIIAEAGVNHNGSRSTACRLIEAAAEAGADAVKFQTFRAAELLRRNAPKAEYQKATTVASESQYDMVQRLELDEEAHRDLIEHAAQRGIRFISTPFDCESLDLLVSAFQLPMIKLGSGEVTNAPLLYRAATSGCDVILSTGMSTLEEVEAALGVLAFGFTCPDSAPHSRAFVEAFRTSEGQAALRDHIMLLHCTSEYPAPPDEVNLRCLETLRRAFDLPVGLSDHTAGIAVPIAAVALGARAIEKHFTLDRSQPGPDHAASLEPEAFAAMVAGIREVEVAIGRAEKQPSLSELKNLPIVRRSLVAAKRILKGTPLTENDIGIKRPADGVSPMRYWDYLGHPANRDYSPDEPLDL
jgi:N-acetylneuraminate synthase